MVKCWRWWVLKYFNFFFLYLKVTLWYCRGKVHEIQTSRNLSSFLLLSLFSLSNKIITDVYQQLFWQKERNLKKSFVNDYIIAGMRRNWSQDLTLKDINLGLCQWTLTWLEQVSYKHNVYWLMQTVMQTFWIELL